MTDNSKPQKRRSVEEYRGSVPCVDGTGLLVMCVDEQSLDFGLKIPKERVQQLLDEIQAYLVKYPLTAPSGPK